MVLVLASVIEGKLNLRRLASPSLALSITLASAFIYVFWSGLSLAWTPFPGESGGRYATFVTIVLAGFILVLLLKDRVGASRLYALSVGVTIGWIMCLGISFAPDIEIEHSTIEQSLITLIPMTPTTIVWLIYRRRDLLALVLSCSAIFTVISLQDSVMILAFAVSCGVFLFALASPDRTRAALAYGFGISILVAPLLPLIIVGPVRIFVGDESIVTQVFDPLYQIITDDPFRLLTGHGFDTLLRAARAGLIPPNSPHGLLIDCWFELGLIGALSFAALLIGLVMLSSTMTRPSAAAMLAVMAGAFVVGVFGRNLPLQQWLASLALAALAIGALERGQYKTARPRSRDIAELAQQTHRFSFVPHWLQF